MSTHIRAHLLPAILFLIALPRLCSPIYATECDSSPILVRNTNVWTAAGVLRGRDVLFRNRRVESILTAGKAPADSSVRVIDGSGHTLLPGLIDSHLHFVIPGGLPVASGTAAPNPADIAGRQLLLSGVTYGRLHLDSIEQGSRLKRESEDPCSALPRFQAGGPGLGGGPNVKDVPQFWGIQDPDDANSKINRIAAAGFEWVALHEADRFPTDQLNTIASAARQAGLRLFGAATRPEELRAGLEIGVETIDYLDLTETPAYSPEMLAGIRSRANAWIVPPVGIFERHKAFRRNPRLLEDSRNFAFLTRDQVDYILARAKSELAGNRFVLEGARASHTFPKKMRQLWDSGIPVAVGSDSGSPAHFQADAIWWELETWRRYGASPHQALMAATEIPAKALRRHDVGRIAVGVRADFVLYKGDVLRGPLDGGRVLAVAKGGVLFVREGKWVGPE